MVGIHTVIDASTARPEEDSFAIDWAAKAGLGILLCLSY